MEVETMTTKKLLVETLNQLSPEDFDKFKLLIGEDEVVPVIWRSRLKAANTQDVVELMVETYRRECVEETRKVLMKMSRTDLVQRLSDIDSGTEVYFQGPVSQMSQIQEEPMTSMIEELQETLKDLNDTEFNHFKRILQKTVKQRGLPRIFSLRMEGEDRADVVELMVAMYSEQSVDVIREVFKKMNRNDLVQKLTEISSASEDPEIPWRSAWFDRPPKPTGQGSSRPPIPMKKRVVKILRLFPKQQDSSVWTKLAPEVNNVDADEDPTYSLQSEAGQFECSVSGLRWVCEENANFKYQFCSWGGHMERMESRQYMPAGALINISIIAGKLTEVHLPHWICIEDNPKILDKFAVLHIDECGDVVEKPSEVTASHVKLIEPNFSLWGVLIEIFFPTKIECNVLMYYEPNTRFLKLHVYVIPLDPALQQKVDKEESSSGYKKITKKLRPDKSLQMQQRFTLTADIDTATIHPMEIILRYDNQDPNFYEVYIENPDRKFNMTLHTSSKKSEAVWTCEIQKDDHPTSSPVEAADSSTGSCSYAAVGDMHFVDKHRGALIQRVSNIDSVLDDLLDKKVIKREAYTKIRVIATPENKIRALYEGPLKAAEICKDIFYQILQKHEEYLINDLQGKNIKHQVSQPVIQYNMFPVETMVSVIELLFETLEDLSDEELKKYGTLLWNYKPHFYMQWMKVTDHQDTVFVTVQTYGQESVLKTKEALEKMERMDLVEKLSDSSSGFKKKQLDEHLSALIHKVATMAAVKELLLETLMGLSNRDFSKFRWFLQLTTFQNNLPQITRSQMQHADRTEIMDLMMAAFSQQSVEVTREVFMDMNRTDLMQKLPEISSEFKDKLSVDERYPALIQKVETMASVIELLLETLEDLSDEELEEFKRITMSFIQHDDFFSDIIFNRMETANQREIVLITVQTSGQDSVLKTKEALEKMKRMDLVEKLSDSSSGYKKKLSVDERRSALIQKVAAVAAVKHLLLESLNDLSFQELEEFGSFLESISYQKNLPDISWKWSPSSHRTEIVDLMVDQFGQQSVEVTREVFRHMNRTDLIQKLPETSSGQKEKHSVDEPAAASRVNLTLHDNFE